MAVYKHGKHEIEVYDSIQNLPILRFQKFNKYQMIQSEIGSDFTDYDKRTEKALAFLQKKMIPEAIQELDNRRQTVFNAYNEFTPMGRSFAVMVKRIDDKNYEFFAPDDLDRILVHLNDIGFDIEKTVTSLVAVKKKIETELAVYFQKSFPRGGNKEETALRHNRINLQLDKIIEGREGIDDQIFKIEKDILQQDLPNVWNVWKDNNMERVLEVDFRKYGLTVAEMSGQDLDKMTTFDFYATVELLIEKRPKNGKHNS